MCNLTVDDGFVTVSGRVSRVKTGFAAVVVPPAVAVGTGAYRGWWWFYGIPRGEA
jgi:hypothetical protein